MMQYEQLLIFCRKWFQNMWWHKLAAWCLTLSLPICAGVLPDCPCDLPVHVHLSECGCDEGHHPSREKGTGQGKDGWSARSPLPWPPGAWVPHGQRSPWALRWCLGPVRTGHRHCDFLLLVKHGRDKPLWWQHPVPLRWHGCSHPDDHCGHHSCYPAVQVEFLGDKDQHYWPCAATDLVGGSSSIRNLHGYLVLHFPHMGNWRRGEHPGQQHIARLWYHLHHPSSASDHAYHGRHAALFWKPRPPWEETRTWIRHLLTAHQLEPMDLQELPGQAASHWLPHKLLWNNSLGYHSQRQPASSCLLQVPFFSLLGGYVDCCLWAIWRFPSWAEISGLG